MIKNRLGGALRRRKGWAWLIGSFLAVIFVVPSSLWALEPKSKYPVEYVKDKLTINAEDVAVGQFLNQVRATPLIGTVHWHLLLILCGTVGK